MVAIVSTLVIFTFKIARDKTLKHGQPYLSSTIGHGS
jgi:hypothetical protein